MVRFGLTLALFLLPSALLAEPQEQWIVVTAPAFRTAIEPLCQQRQKQGLRVVVVQTTDLLGATEIRAGNAAKLREHVNKLCRDYPGRSYVLLVGAIEAGTLPQSERKTVPALPGTIGRMKGQPSDTGFGCPNAGRLPTVAVGRFPARSEEEAAAMVRKTLALEQDSKPGPWRRRLTVLAGIPAYNPVVDRLVEGLALSRFAQIDPVWSGRALYTNPQSRFCVPDHLLRSLARKYVEQGQAFTLYLGHSNAAGLYGGGAPFLDRSDWANLHIERGAGVFVTFGCNGCQLKGADGEGYGVAAIRNPHGPAAVIGSHSICFAAMVQLAADGVCTSTLIRQPPQRLGASWLALEEGVARGKIDDFTFKMLDAVDGDSQIPQATQRQEHLEMFVLLGDPALRLPLVPTDLDLHTSEDLAAGTTLTVHGTAPPRLAGARVHLTLERSVNSVPPSLEPLPKEADSSVRERVMLANHERANRFAVATAESVVRDGRFEARLELPAKMPWRRLILRADAATDREEGMGVLALEVRKNERGEP
jgi:hypothetical protein